MPPAVSLQPVQPRKLAAVRRELAPSAVASGWKPALDKVWEFLAKQPGLRTDGHNIFLYCHPTKPGLPTLCDFGVEVTRTFEPAGEVYPTETYGERPPSLSTAVHTAAFTRRTTPSRNGWRRIVESALATHGRFTAIRHRTRQILRQRSCTS